MRLLHSLAKTHASFDDPNLVSHAGLVPVMALAERAGLGDLVAEHVRPGGPSGDPAGSGFDPGSVKLKSGLRNMATRAQTLGGDFNITSDAHGSRVSARFPRDRARSMREITTMLR